MSELWVAKQGLKGREGLAGAQVQSDSNNLIRPERSKGPILPIFAPPRAPISAPPHPRLSPHPHFFYFRPKPRPNALSFFPTLAISSAMYFIWLT